VVRIKVRHLHQMKGTWWWVPSKSAKALGFRAVALGKETSAAALKAEELNARLDTERAAAKAGTTAAAHVQAGTVAALIRAYLASPGYADLAARTKKEYATILRRIEDKAGAVPVAGITRPDLIKVYDKLRAAHGESMAAAMMRVWRLLLSYAHDSGWRPDNPALKFRLRSVRPRQVVWTPEQVAAFTAAATAAGRHGLALAVELAYDIGQRQGDIRSLTWEQFTGTALVLRQAKTGTPVHAALSPEMAARLTALAPPPDQRRGVLLVLNTRDKPYSLHGFTHEFAKIREAAGLPDTLQFRDLRRTAATEMGEAGATDDELRAMTGHLSRNVVAVYVKPTPTMAESAQEKRTRHRKSKAAG